jgi:DNA-binding response OmpR family regulator
MSTLHTSSIASSSQKSPIEDIHWDTVHHTIVIKRVTIKLTAAEYRILFPLRHGTPMTYAHLAWVTCPGELDEKVRMRMDKRIENIRSKLRGSGISVYCIVCYGYMLLPEPPPEKEREA